jgi:hypothetical protein
MTEAVAQTPVSQAFLGSLPGLGAVGHAGQTSIGGEVHRREGRQGRRRSGGGGAWRQAEEAISRAVRADWFAAFQLVSVSVASSARR